MATNTILDVVCDVLRLVQEASGREWNELNSDSKPIGMLEGFDSLSAIEVTVIIEERLGVKLGSDTLFVSDDGRRALRLGEICARINDVLKARGSLWQAHYASE